MSDETYVFLPSFAQQRLWFLEQLSPGTPAYLLPAAVRFVGHLDSAALWRTLDEIVQRHESLRTTFTTVEDQLVQVVAATWPLALPIADLGGLPGAERAAMIERLIADAARSPFDLACGPLLRARLLRSAAQEHVLVLVLHHIIS